MQHLENKMTAMSKFIHELSKILEQQAQKGTALERGLLALQALKQGGEGSLSKEGPPALIQQAGPQRAQDARALDALGMATEPPILEFHIPVTRPFITPVNNTSETTIPLFKESVKLPVDLQFPQHITTGNFTLELQPPTENPLEKKKEGPVADWVAQGFLQEALGESPTPLCSIQAIEPMPPPYPNWKQPCVDAWCKSHG